jgi:hypothetical protein
MDSLIQKRYDRADLLMSAGCSTFVSAALVFVIPRFGIAMLEILIGLFLMGCAFVARARPRGRVRLQPAGDLREAGAKWFDRFDIAMILAVIMVQAAVAGLLRRLGWSEGTIRILPLILLGTAILLKPRLMNAIERRAQKNRHISNGVALAPSVPATAMTAANAWRPAENTSRDPEEKGAR